MKTRPLFLLVFFAVLAGSIQARANDRIVLNTSLREPFTTADKTGFIDLLVQEMFRRIGIEAEVIVYQESATALANANDGVDDGLALRIEGLENEFPNLTRVPEKLVDLDFVAYSTGPPGGGGDWAEIKDARIAYIGGWRVFRQYLAGHKLITRAATARQMFDLLAAGAVDYILYERWQALWRARQLGVTIQPLGPALGKREMFMYLNDRHSGLVDKASAALSAMKKDGTYRKIFDKTLGRVRE